MNVARVRVAELATAISAIECDGALYDLDALERLARGSGSGGDFFERVVAARGLGLDELHARLVAGRRPTEARLLEGDYAPLPPVDTARSAYVQLAPAELQGDAPAYRFGDARALVGSGLPTVVRGETVTVEPGFAVVLGDDLDDASPMEARRAILGFTLVLAWSTAAGWSSLEPQPPAHLGPWLALGSRGSTTTPPSILVRVGTEQGCMVCDERLPFSVEETLSYLSRHVVLRAGDVVGLGSPRGARRPVSVGERVALEWPSVMTLRGSAARVPLDPHWRAG